VRVKRSTATVSVAEAHDEGARVGGGARRGALRGALRAEGM
jgi:hypothetical protein